MLTIEDIRNPERKSGFNNVDKPNPDKNYFRARTGHTGAGPKTNCWRGPNRTTPEEAAQDLCNRVNWGIVSVKNVKLNGAGHTGRRDPLERDEELEAAYGVIRDKRAQQEGKQGYVYLIGVEGDWTGVKIGYSVKPEARVGELQTGNPRKLILLASKEAAEAEEHRIHSRFIQNRLVGEWFRPCEGIMEEFGLSLTELVSS